MKGTHGLAYAVLLLVIIACKCPQSNSNNTPTGNGNSSPSASPVNDNSQSKANENTAASGLTMATFNQLKTGMTYEQVVKILGTDGKELSSSEIGGIKTVMYQWEGSGSLGANMNAMFQNGKLMSKSQFGLK
jgi:hypothetical protein